MDSLVANYASSDEDEPQSLQPSSLSNPTSSFASLPHTKSSSSSPSSLLFSSLPKPKTSQPSTTIFHNEDPQKSPNPTSKLFSSLPQLKSENPISASAPKPKRVVQIRAPVNPFARKSVELDDEDDEEEEEKERKRRNESESSAQAPSVKSFLSSIPAPRNSASLGALPTLGSGRRAIVDADVPASSSVSAENQHSVIVEQTVEDYGNYEQGTNQNYAENAGYYGTYESGGVDQYNGGVDSSSYGNSESYVHQVNNWAPEVSAVSERAFRVPGKRGRSDIPIEIVEVKQDELMKNRPREDQAKLTGIAFGPSYQPASSKGKPSKLHKRKHQIGTLYFDMKQKETELAERRAKGFLTKAETQAKYGW